MNDNRTIPPDYVVEPVSRYPQDETSPMPTQITNVPSAPSQAPGLMENWDDRRVMKWAEGIADLARSTSGWTSHIAWAVRRAVQEVVREHMRSETQERGQK